MKSLPKKRHQQPVRSAYQTPANNTFLTEQTSHQQPASSTLLSEQTSTSHQPLANRTGCRLSHVVERGRSELMPTPVLFGPCVRYPYLLIHHRKADGRRRKRHSQRGRGQQGHRSSGSPIILVSLLLLTWDMAGKAAWRQLLAGAWLLLWLLPWAASAIHRSDFPASFLFGTSTSSYQVRAPCRLPAATTSLSSRPPWMFGLSASGNCSCAIGELSVILSDLDWKANSISLDSFSATMLIWPSFPALDRRRIPWGKQEFKQLGCVHPCTR
jgi:hypothetical protein